MTPEQKQRLEQIRERRSAITQGKWSWWHSQFNDLSGYAVSGEKSEGIAAIVGHHDQDCAADAAFIARSPEDIDFLLSLVKEQETPDCWPDMAAVNREYHYTVMRSACVEKLRERASRYKTLADDSLPNDQTAARTAAAATALNSAADELQSLSIEKSSL